MSQYRYCTTRGDYRSTFIKSGPSCPASRRWSLDWTRWDQLV